MAGHLTFYKDVLPVLQRHCQVCHRPGEIAPMPFVTYKQTKPWTKAIRQAVQFAADAAMVRRSRHRALRERSVTYLPTDSGRFAIGWIKAQSRVIRAMLLRLRIGQPGGQSTATRRILEMPRPVLLPAEGDVEYTYEIVPTGFTKDTWVQMSEIRPSARDHVHHAVVYVRPPSSHWLKHVSVGVPFTASTLKEPQDRRDAMWTDSEVLLVYAPGSAPDRWATDQAKYIPAGSDLVFQMHYTTNGHAARTRPVSA